MKRIYIYSILYIITLLFYIFFNYIGGSDSIVFFSFILSSLALVFAREELPNPKYFKILEVRQYQERRINIYGYSMAAILIVGSLLYSSLTLYFKFSSGVASIITWPILISIFYFSTIYLDNKAFEQNLYNYLRRNSNLDSKLLKDIAAFTAIETRKTFIADDLFDKAEKRFSYTMSIPFLHETLELITIYLAAQSEPLSPDEISASNKL